MNEPDLPGDEVKEPLLDCASTALPAIRLPEGDPEELARRVRAISDPAVLTSAFQPVFHASTGDLDGCEALARLPAGSGFEGPYEAFRAAGRTGLLLPLQTAAILAHLRDVRGVIAVAAGLRLYLNVTAEVFVDGQFGARWLVDQVRASGLVPSQVVLELPEIVRIRDLARFVGFLEPFRAAGFRIALDDFGAGYTSLRMVVELSPDIVKVDRVFIEGIASHDRKRVLVESVVSLCHRVGCAVVAEGIEATEDLEACLAAGVDSLQGYLFARPSPAAEAFNAAPLALPIPFSAREGDDLRAVVEEVPPVEAGVLLSEVCQRFVREPHTVFLPVVRDSRPVRLLRRELASAAVRVATAEGRLSPAAGDPLPGFEESFDRIPEAAAPEEAAALVGRRPASRRFDPLVVVGGELQYRGLLAVDVLLAELARLKSEYALQSHPVTQLPGRLVLERTIARRLARRSPFALGRVNVCGFGAFNLRYGSLRGDDLLGTVAGILREGLRDDREGLVAHLTNDDFAFLCAPADARRKALELVRAFAESSPRLHDPADAAAGAFFVRDRAGELRRSPLTGIAIGVAVWNGSDPTSTRGILFSAEGSLASARRMTTLRVHVDDVSVRSESVPSIPCFELPQEATEAMEPTEATETEDAEGAPAPTEATEATDSMEITARPGPRKQPR